IMSEGAINQQPVVAAGVPVAIFSRVSANNTYASGMFDGTGVASSDNLTFVFSTSQAPEVISSSGSVWGLGAGGVRLKSDLSATNLSVSTPNSLFDAPIAMSAGLNLAQVTGSGTSSISLVSGGNVSLSGSLTNSSNTSQGAGASLSALGQLNIYGGVSVAH